MNFDIYIFFFFENLKQILKFNWKVIRITCTLHEDRYTFIIKFRSVLFKMRNVSDKIVGTIKTRILCSITVLWKSCRLWDNVEKYCRAGQATGGNIMRPIRIACWISKAKNTQSQYVILIAFPLRQWLRERALISHFYLHCLSCWR